MLDVIPERARSFFSMYNTVSTLFNIQTVPSAVLVLTTPKGSILRFLWMPVLGYTGYRFFCLSNSITTSSAYNAAIVGLDFAFVLQCMNLLIFSGWDQHDLIREGVIEKSKNFFSKVFAIIGLIQNPRGLNTKRQAKNTPPLPDYIVQQSKEPSRGRFLLRQGFIWTWQWLLLDALLALDRMEPEDVFNRLYGKGAEFRYLSATSEEWFARFFGPILNLFIVSRLSVDLMFRLLSICWVGVGLSSPADWPPSFGSMWDAYTLRNFWGSFMPQYLRWPLTAASSFVTRNVLHLPHPSLLERYTNILFVFALSGSYFTIIDVVMGVPISKSGAGIFFMSFAGGILLEDGVRAMFSQSSGNDKSTTEEEPKQSPKGFPRPWWMKAVGAAWVLFFLASTTPWILYPGKRVPTVDRWLLPGSVTGKVGMPAIWAVIVTGWFILKFVFRAGL